jgi:hypothetical protein
LIPFIVVLLAALAGLPPYAAVGVAATLLVAVVQALVGTWPGRTLTPGRALTPGPASS